MLFYFVSIPLGAVHPDVRFFIFAQSEVVARDSEFAYDSKSACFVMKGTAPMMNAATVVITISGIM